MTIVNERVAAHIEGDFVVFLIGAQVNRWWKIPQILQVGRAMGRMLEELDRHPELGLLHHESWPGRTAIIVQYWRSFEHLHAYARMKDAEHLPAWADFNRKIGLNGDVGIWHETYLVRAGEYEAIYGNMPAFGLAKAGNAIPASGKATTAKGRLGQSSGEDAPIEPAA